MALKFLNKKGWHTGSLRNIENVWKAEQKHDAEQKKLEELRKQIHEERERSEFRLLQEQAGLVPRQERLEFLYDSGLAVGKGSSEGFKALEALPKPDNEAPSSSSSAKAAVPGALFEEKPQSANDAWRKLHSDPLLMIRQREQEALARVRNNPIQMDMIRKSVEAKNHKEKTSDGEKRKKLHGESSKHRRHSSSRHQYNSDIEEKKRTGNQKHSSSRHQYNSDIEEKKRTGNQKHSSSRHQYNSDIDKKKRTGNQKHSEYDDDHFNKACPDSEDEFGERGSRRKEDSCRDLKYKQHPSSDLLDPETKNNDSRDRIKRNYEKSEHRKYPSDGRTNSDAARKERENQSLSQANSYNSSAMGLRHESHHKRRNIAPKLSEEERAARLREMQVDAELHEEQRWKRLRKAEEDDAREVTQAGMPVGRNFLDAAQKSVYGAEKGGSSTIEESVRRRTHYLQGRSEANAGNAFRR